MFRIIRFFTMVLFLLSAAGVSSYAQAPTITAGGNQAYCPLSEIPVVTYFSISNPGGEDIDKINIQISTGYENGLDVLRLLPGHPTVTASSFNVQEGKLTLTAQNSGAQGLADLIAAVKDVVFESTSSAISGEKIFSFTLGSANYLERTGHFYEYIPSVGISWTDARVEAESRYNEYGWQGYLATITYPEEAVLSGEQAAGTGWIGGSDEETEGVWKWMTGPEAGTIFWNGGQNGSAPPGQYSNWNTGEPNNLGNEDYAHVTAPNIGILGSWNDLPNQGSTGDYEPKGYIVEYGGLDPVNEAPISTISTKIYVPEVSVTDGARCGPGSVTLTATTNGDIVYWFDTPTGGNPIGSGSPFPTPPISSDTTFYALGAVNGCTEGTRTPVQAVIQPIPIVSSSDVIVCGTGTATFHATASAGTIYWYATPALGSPLATGSSFTTPTITSTTTYYMEAVDNGCATTPRVPVTATVVYTSAPTASSPQYFCENDMPIAVNLTSTGDNIKWYDVSSGGTPIADSTALHSGTYYVSQTVSGCESPIRTAVDVVVYESPKPKSPTELGPISVCDDELDGSGINGFSTFDITLNELEILNGQSSVDFAIAYYTEDNFSASSEITNPVSFMNTQAFGQTIYVRVTNKLDNGCFNDTSFEINVHETPQIISSIELKNCDEDGVTDGFTDYNLNEANAMISSNAANEVFTFYLNPSDAQSGINPVDPSPYNNITGNTVYVRVETVNGCYKIATVSLNVSATAFSDNYIFEMESCEMDDVNDGIANFDLTIASAEILSLLPPGQPLQVYYYHSLDDALLEENEIQSPSDYRNLTPDSENLYVRIENEDNGDCYDIGPYVRLNVQRRPEFVVVPQAQVCLNLPPINLEVLDADGLYTYEWRDESGTVISTDDWAEVHAAGTYTVVASNAQGCLSFPRSIFVTASNTATVDNSAITIVENSMNNSITINPVNFGIGDYEFALGDIDGPYSNNTYYEQLLPGIYTLFVRDINGCGITAHDVYILGFRKYFSPNGDGINDFWQIKGLDPSTMQASPVQIFDRFGKILTVMDPFGNGWDGTLNGDVLPATDYWYSVVITDGTGRVRHLQGHFSLLR